jgi:hypothetical protein
MYELLVLQAAAASSASGQPLLAASVGHVCSSDNSSSYCLTFSFESTCQHYACTQ